MAPLSSPKSQVPEDYVYPSGARLVLLMTSIFIGLFLVALDKLIITTAIPQITNDFHSVNDIGWYGTAYLLTNCAFILMFGKMYTVFDIKITFIVAIVLFEIGSAISGAAPNSIAFIIGRAIAGLGAGGVQSGILTIIVYAVPLSKRPQYQGFFGAVFGIASVLGPLVGGAFTTNVTWRWCFYINLPLGAVVLIFVYLLLDIPKASSEETTLKHKLQQLNGEGLIALIPGVVCLCLALQWGGFTYTWNDGRIIALLVLAFALLISFAVIQVLRPERATVPPRIFAQRSIAGGVFVSCCTGAHQTVLLYFLPIWFQAIKGDSAVTSGVHILPMILSLVVASIASGILTSRIGYYMPFLIIGISITTVGTGLITTFNVNTTVGQWIGYQILYGFGLGLFVQVPNMAAQTVLPRKEVSIGASLMFFSQTLFAAVFASVGQNVLDAQLVSRFANIIKLTPQQIDNAGATSLLNLVPPQLREAALEAYNGALRVCFLVALVMVSVSILGALIMEWRSVKTAKDDGSKGNTSQEESSEKPENINNEEEKSEA